MRPLLLLFVAYFVGRVHEAWLATKRDRQLSLMLDEAADFIEQELEPALVTT